MNIIRVHGSQYVHHVTVTFRVPNDSRLLSTAFVILNDQLDERPARLRQ